MRLYWTHYVAPQVFAGFQFHLDALSRNLSAIAARVKFSVSLSGWLISALSLREMKNEWRSISC